MAALIQPGTDSAGTGYATLAPVLATGPSPYRWYRYVRRTSRSSFPARDGVPFNCVTSPWNASSQHPSRRLLRGCREIGVDRIVALAHCPDEDQPEASRELIVWACARPGRVALLHIHSGQRWRQLDHYDRMSAFEICLSRLDEAHTIALARHHRAPFAEAEEHTESVTTVTTRLEPRDHPARGNFTVVQRKEEHPGRPLAGHVEVTMSAGDGVRQLLHVDSRLHVHAFVEAVDMAPDALVEAHRPKDG